MLLFVHGNITVKLCLRLRLALIFPGSPSQNCIHSLEFSSSDHIRGINTPRAKDRELLCNRASGCEGLHQCHFIWLDPNKQHRTFPVNPVCYQMFDWVMKTRIKMIFSRIVFLLQQMSFSEILVLQILKKILILLLFYTYKRFLWYFITF